MGRFIKEALDYFPVLCGEEPGVEFIEIKYGMTGYGVLIKLLKRIYGVKGYYCEWNEDEEMLFARSTGEKTDLIEAVIMEAIKRKIFSAEMYEKYSVLTSKNIQLTYVTAASRRESISIDEKYLLLDKNELPKNANRNLHGISVDINNDSADISVDRNNNSENKSVGRNKQRKEENSKEKNRREEESIEEYPPSARGLADTPLNQTSSRGLKEQSISEKRSPSIVTDYTNTNDTNDSPYTYHYDYEEERTERDYEPEDYYGYESEESDEDYDYDDSDRLDPYLLFKEKREKDQKIYEENLKRMQDSDSRYANTSHSALQVKNVNSPTIDDVKDYAKEECLHYVDCEWFVTYYSSHGWENVRDWRSALRRWNEKDKARTKKQLGIQNVQQTEEDYDREMLKYFEEFDRRMGVDVGV